MVTYQLESWEDYYKDCQALWLEHYEEIAARKSQRKMQPDVRSYMAAEAAGQLQILTARENGRMVGYMLFFVKPHMHYAGVLCGFEDSIFLVQSHRKGWVGVRLVKESIKYLQRRGVQEVFVMENKAKDLSKLFKGLGFAPSHVLWSKWIGG